MAATVTDEITLPAVALIVCALVEGVTLLVSVVIETVPEPL
jgi:hypothetical protein